MRSDRIARTLCSARRGDAGRVLTIINQQRTEFPSREKKTKTEHRIEYYNYLSTSHLTNRQSRMWVSTGGRALHHRVMQS